MRTVILCGGRGTHAYPHTTVVPKPLLEVDGSDPTSNVYAYRHQGFWKSMDTYKGAQELTERAEQFLLAGVAPGVEDELLELGYCDSTRARARLGWSPRHSLRGGLAETIRWYRRALEKHPQSLFIPGRTA